MKKRILSAIVAATMLLSSTTVFADGNLIYGEHSSYDIESITDYNNSDYRRRFWSEFLIIAEFSSVTLRDRPGQINSLNLLEVHPGGLRIGLDDYYDEDLRNEILSLEGINSDYITFVNTVADERLITRAFGGDISFENEEHEVQFNDEFNTVSDFNKSIILSRRGQTSPISFITSNDEGLVIGLFDYYDEDFKNEILLLPGICSEIVTFTTELIFDDSWRERWNNSAYHENYYQYDATYICEFEPIAPLSTLWMGDRIRVGVRGTATIGSSLNRWGDLFWTADHGRVRIGNQVSLTSNNRRIGFVVARRFDPASGQDAALVDTWGTGFYADTSLSDFRANPPINGTSVSARGAYSGLMRGTIHMQRVDSWCPDRAFFFQHMLGVRDMIPVDGDSGAALIFGNSSVGILSFGGTMPDGAHLALFSRTNNL